MTENSDAEMSLKTCMEARRFNLQNTKVVNLHLSDIAMRGTTGT